jgi:hypothetical protein
VGTVAPRPFATYCDLSWKKGDPPDAEGTCWGHPINRTPKALQESLDAQFCNRSIDYVDATHKDPKKWPLQVPIYANHEYLDLTAAKATWLGSLPSPSRWRINACALDDQGGSSCNFGKIKEIP